MLVLGDKRVVSRMAVGGWRNGHWFITAAPGGPAGSSLMSFFFTFTLGGLSTVTGRVFQRWSGSTTGWAFWLPSANTLRVTVGNSTPASVNITAPAFTALNVGRTFICICTYSNGTVSLWLNAVAVAPVTLGTGYTSAALGTSIGGISASPAPPGWRIHAAGMLDGIDLTAQIATLTAQWQEDCQQGRAPTWPRVAAVNSDWLWLADDIVGGGGTTGPIWTPRYTIADTMTRVLQPQSASFMPRF